jgi:hypothetical protein
MSLKMQRNPSPGHDFPREILVSAAGSSPIAGSPSIQNPADSSRTKKWREGTARHLLPRMVTEVSARQYVLREIPQPAVDPNVLADRGDPPSA